MCVCVCVRVCLSLQATRCEQLRHIPIPELIALESKLRIDVAAEDSAQAIAAGGAPPGRILVRFGR